MAQKVRLIKIHGKCKVTFREIIWISACLTVSFKWVSNSVTLFNLMALKET